MRWNGMRMALLLASIAAATTSAALAADPAAVQAPIKGSDAMGDKGRSGPDGWSWAPQTRDQVPADKANQTANNGRGDANSLAAPDAGKTIKPGDDPGTPVPNASAGPGTMDSGSTHRP